MPETNISKPDNGRVRGILKLLILKELEKSSATGYELIKRIGSRISKKPSPGSVYPLLRELADSGFLTVKSEGNRKIYSLSEKGRTVLDETSRREKEAVLRKIEVLKSSGILTEDEADEMIEFVRIKKEEWLSLFEIKEWSKFLNLLLKAFRKSRSEVEQVIAQAIEKLEEIERGEKGE